MLSNPSNRHQNHNFLSSNDKATLLHILLRVLPHANGQTLSKNNVSVPPPQPPTSKASEASALPILREYHKASKADTNITTTTTTIGCQRSKFKPIVELFSLCHWSLRATPTLQPHVFGFCSWTVSGWRCVFVHKVRLLCQTRTRSELLLSWQTSGILLRPRKLALIRLQLKLCHRFCP